MAGFSSAIGIGYASLAISAYQDNANKIYQHVMEAHLANRALVILCAPRLKCEYVAILQNNDLGARFRLLEWLSVYDCEFKDHFLAIALNFLSSKDSYSRRSAIEFLESYRTQDKLIYIIACLSDKDISVCIRAAEAIAKVGKKEHAILFDIALNSSFAGHGTFDDHIKECKKQLLARFN